MYVHNHPVKSDCQALNAIPPKIICLDSLKKLIELVNVLNVCAGHPDNKFVLFCKAKKGKFTSRDGKEVAFLDDYLPISLNGQAHLQTIRTKECDVLVRGVKCVACKNYRRTIRLLCNRWHKRNSDSMSDSSCHTNHRFLTTPEKHHKLKKLRKRARSAEAELKRQLKAVIEQSDEMDQHIYTQ